MSAAATRYLWLGSATTWPRAARPSPCATAIGSRDDSIEVSAILTALRLPYAGLRVLPRHGPAFTGTTAATASTQARVARHLRMRLLLLLKRVADVLLVGQCVVHGGMVAGIDAEIRILIPNVVDH